MSQIRNRPSRPWCRSMASSLTSQSTATNMAATSRFTGFTIERDQRRRPGPDDDLDAHLLEQRIGRRRLGLVHRARSQPRRTRQQDVLPPPLCRRPTRNMRPAISYNGTQLRPGIRSTSASTSSAMRFRSPAWATPFPTTAMLRMTAMSRRPIPTTRSSSPIVGIRSRSTSVTWNGCIEERRPAASITTARPPTSPSRTSAYDLNINLHPDQRRHALAADVPADHLSPHRRAPTIGEHRHLAGDRGLPGAGAAPARLDARRHASPMSTR